MSNGITPYAGFKKYSPPPRPPFDYGALIKGTLRLVWRHKFLWFFGLFAGGSVNSFGSWNFNFGGSGSPDSGDDASQPSQTATDVGNWINDHAALIVAVAVAVVALSILIWLWSVVCRGAVIGSTQDIREGKAASFGSAWRRGRNSFGRLLLFDLFLLGVSLGVMLIIGAVTLLLIFLAVSGAAGKTIVITLGVLGGLALMSLLLMGLGYLTCFTIWPAIWVPLTIVLIFATRAIVLDGERPIKAIRLGWRMFVENIARSLLLFLLSAGLSLASSIGAIAAVLVTAVPAAIAWVFAWNGDWQLTGITLAAVLSLLPLAAFILVSALINTYFTSYWTIVYLKLSGRDTEPGPHESTLPYPPAPLPGYHP